jgi:hypothetical protein
MKVKAKISGHVEQVPGELYRYWADSDTFGTPPYLVDLIAARGFGVCGCKDYEISKRIMRKEGETDPVIASCKHIRRCRLLWASEELIRRANAMPKAEVEE